MLYSHCDVFNVPENDFSGKETGYDNPQNLTFLSKLYHPSLRFTIFLFSFSNIHLKHTL